MDDLQPAYTPEQLQALQHADEMDKLRVELNDECLRALRTQHHQAHFKTHCMRTQFASELSGLLTKNIDEYTESVQDKVKALLKKYDVPLYPVIFVNGEYYSDYSEEIEMELIMIPQEYRAYNLTAEQKAAVLQNKLTEMELSL